MEYKVGTKCCDKINSIAGTQCLDANGNQVNDTNQNENNDNIECDCVGVEIDTQMKSSLSVSNSIHHSDGKIVKKLQTITLSDYGKTIFIIFFLGTFQHRGINSKSFSVSNLLEINTTSFVFLFESSFRSFTSTKRLNIRSIKRTKLSFKLSKPFFCPLKHHDGNQICRPFVGKFFSLLTFCLLTFLSRKVFLQSPRLITDIKIKK